MKNCLLGRKDLNEETNTYYGGEFYDELRFSFVISYRLYFVSKFEYEYKYEKRS